MRITLCYPPLIPGYQPKYSLQPLGVLSIAALLEREGFDVAVLDADIAGLTLAETTRRILDTSPDLVGLSLMTPQLHAALGVAARLKRARPSLPIVLGGAHVDATKADVFEMSDCVDFAIHGEGEWALLDCCRALDQGGGLDAVRALPNVICRDGDAVTVNPPRPFLRALDSLPPVDYRLVDVERYRLPTIAGRFAISMMLSRGCPFRCTFCDAPQVMGKKLRTFSIPRIIEDLRTYQRRHGATHVVFKDSTFTANPAWAGELCEAILDAGLAIRWRCNTRADLVPAPLLALMARAGCEIINFGVESGDPEILRTLRKEVDLDAVADAFLRCRRLGIRTYATLLVGSPGETDASMRRTLAFAKRIRPSLCNFHVATAYPGTPMYEQALAVSEVEPRWWARPAAGGASPFAIRSGWTAAGALRSRTGFDAETWQRRATRAWYLRPRFVWDTLGFTLEHPEFAAHAWNLGRELLPLFKLRNLLPERPLPSEERVELLARCPSAPVWDYARRS
jgi:anaerobic magnesium-protoporphyrin IX monomethyl ester cyclase